ncbi:unnamed protein product [Ascophyllum nodosum]
MNIPACDYDGGDCCECTCVEGSNYPWCFVRSLDCVDPSVEEELYQCQPPPPIAPLCAADTQRTWVVDNPVQARALAEAVNCSGGTFDVMWKGSITVETTIYVTNGTVLNITGVRDSSAVVMDGGLNVQLLTMIDASRYVSDVYFSSGSSVVGGAITVAGSNVTLTRTSFFGNRAKGLGGALYVTNNSCVLFDGDETTFLNNSALGFGGALYASGSSSVDFSGEQAYHLHNAAGIPLYGGALSATSAAVVSWSGVSSFVNNLSEQGGAVYLFNDSSMRWDGRNTTFSSNAATVWSGGAIFTLESNLTWSGNTTFGYNEAEKSGALMVSAATNVSWSGQTSFFNNSASAGGAMYLRTGSYVSWSGPNTTFVSNTATSVAGGAAYVSGSKLSWKGATVIENNRAQLSGGAIYIGGAISVSHGSNVWWSGPNTTFSFNFATLSTGGAVSVTGNLSWSGATTFRDNSASTLGGGVISWDSGIIDWSGDTTFVGNKAIAGGAMFIYLNGRVKWTGRTTFALNRPETEGGAIGSYPLDATADAELMSFLSIAGPTTFVENTCERDGGAMSLTGGLSVEFDFTVNITFWHNSARASGGAVFMSGTDVGLIIPGVSFVSNSAQLGGAVYTTSSGNAKVGFDGVAVPNPTIFYKCSFVGNTAVATGGAIQSAAGEDFITETTFVGNTARVGGALFLAGTSIF